MERHKINTRKQFLEHQKAKVEEFRTKKAEEQSQSIERIKNEEKAIKQREKQHQNQVKS